VQLAKERFSWNAVAEKLVGGIKEGLAGSVPAGDRKRFKKQRAD
jgi:hypothetical protein